MSRSPKAARGLSLEEFLRLPEIDEQPYREYIDGRVEEKTLPQGKHSVLTKKMIGRVDAHAEPPRLGECFPELRCTFAGRSIVPDIAFLLDEHILTDDDGVIVNETLRPPDIQFEIISPDQSVKKTHRKFIHSTAHGCPLGVLIHPERKTVDVYRPGRPPERLADDGTLDLAPVLPGLLIPVSEIFGWLVHRRPNPPDRGAAP